METITDETDLALEDLLAYRVLESDDSAIGRDDRMVVRFASGDIVAYRLDVIEDEEGREDALEMIPIWVRTGEDVRDRVEGVLAELVEDVGN